MTSKLRLLLLLSAAYHSKIQLRMYILQANYKSQLPNLTSQATHFTSEMHCPKTQAKAQANYPKAQANFSGVSSAS